MIQARRATGTGAGPAPSVWNVANGLTVLRVLLVPVFGGLLLADDGSNPAYRWWALVAFTVAMVTDRIDGDIARSRGIVTNFGKVSDPIADKALVSMAVVGLSMVDIVPWWATVVVLMREWGITAVRFWVIRHGVMAAGRGGKVKTLLQALALGFLIMPRWTMPGSGFWDVLAWSLFWVAVALTVLTGIDYVAQALALRRTSERTAMKAARRTASSAPEAPEAPGSAGRGGRSGGPGGPLGPDADR
jgi:CDP-diacylglycerol--glycerol-3-phosphate 3-phosphatidyltransferase